MTYHYNIIIPLKRKQLLFNEKDKIFDSVDVICSILAEGDTCLWGGNKKVSLTVRIQLYPVAAASPLSIKTTL